MVLISCISNIIDWKKSKKIKEECDEIVKQIKQRGDLEMRIEYERLLEIAKKMHTWIFCNTGDEQAVYDKLGLTEEENCILGYGGKIEIPIPQNEETEDESR